MLSGSIIDLEQRGKNNKKNIAKKQFWRTWRTAGKFYFSTASLGKQTVKSSAGTPTKDPPGKTDCGRWLSVTQREMKSRVYDKNSHKKEQKKAAWGFV